MKKKAYISGICILILAVLTALGIIFGVSGAISAGRMAYGPDIVHITVVVAVFYLISCILIEYMYQICVLGSYDGESIARKKIKTFTIIAVLAVILFSYYILILEAQIAVPDSNQARIVCFIIAMVLGVVSLASFLLVHMIILKDVNIPIISRMPENKISGGRIIDSIGKRIYSESNKPKTPEQVLSKYIRYIVNTISILLILWLIVGKSVDYGRSVIGYMTNGEWEKGLNVFAFTACIFVFCTAFTISSVLKYLSEAVIITFDSRGETIGRMVTSLLKYVILILAAFLCLSLLGFNTGTLVASAGVVSLVVGLGAKELISDILAGLFIIIEGEFRVGDIITVNDFRGTVSEIGVRTTKMVDVLGNVKIINNSQITDVINMTKNHSFANCSVGIGYDEDLEHVEEILAGELPKIRERNRLIKGGPYYRGVAQLADSSVVLRIIAECDEEDRIQLERDLNREIKLIFDRNGINIPYPQIVVNEAVKKDNRVSGPDIAGNKADE